MESGTREVSARHHDFSATLMAYASDVLLSNDTPESDKFAQIEALESARTFIDCMECQD